MLLTGLYPVTYKTVSYSDQVRSASPSQTLSHCRTVSYAEHEEHTCRCSGKFLRERVEKIWFEKIGKKNKLKYAKETTQQSYIRGVVLPRNISSSKLQNRFT